MNKQLLSREQFAGMCDTLSNIEGPNGPKCDDTFHHTMRWLKKNGQDIQSNLIHALQLGAVCDCQVIKLRDNW